MIILRLLHQKNFFQKKKKLEKENRRRQKTLTKEKYAKHKASKNKTKRRVLQDIQQTSVSDSSLTRICDDGEIADLENAVGIGTNPDCLSYLLQIRQKQDLVQIHVLWAVGACRLHRMGFS